MVLEKRNELGKRFGKSWLKTNNGELAAFTAYAIAFPDGFLSLVDTYDTLNSGLKNFIVVALALNDCGYLPVGIRLDSGDLAALSLRCREVFEDMADKLNRPFLKELSIVASDSINEKKLRELNANGHSINAFGIGTNLVTCQAQPALGCVFKLVELNGKPRIKFSENPVKTLIPGQKKAFRLFDKNGTPQMDVLIRSDEDAPEAGMETTLYEPFNDDPINIVPVTVSPLLHTIWDKENGANTGTKIISLIEAKGSVLGQIKSLNPDMLSPEDPMEYKVYLSRRLQQELHRVQGELRISLEK